MAKHVPSLAVGICTFERRISIQVKAVIVAQVSHFRWTVFARTTHQTRSVFPAETSKLVQKTVINAFNLHLELFFRLAL